MLSRCVHGEWGIYVHVSKHYSVGSGRSWVSGKWECASVCVWWMGNGGW